MGAQTRTRHFEVGVPLLSIPGQGADPDMGMRQRHLRGRSSSRNGAAAGAETLIETTAVVCGGGQLRSSWRCPFSPTG